MINKVYQQVFGANVRNFDAQKNDFCVVLNFMGDSTSDILRSGISANGYDEVKLDCGDTEAIGKIEDMIYAGLPKRQRVGAGYVNYILLFEYADSDIGGYISDAVNTVRKSRLVSANDKIVLVAVLPESRTTSLGYLDSLEKQSFPQGLMTFFLIREKYNANALRSSIGAILRMYSDHELTGELGRNISDMKMYINQGIKNLSEDGQASLKARQPLCWSTVLAFNQDDKLAFLHTYLSGLFANCIQLRNVTIAGKCGEFYEKTLSGYEKSWVDRLEHAILHIPRITDSEPSLDQSLQQYFDKIYGPFAGDVVGLTLQMNLQKRYDDSKGLVEEAAHHIFRGCDEYYTTDVVEGMLERLEEYISKILTERIEAHEIALKRFIQEEGDISVDLRRYIEKYMSYCDTLSEQVFWGKVKKYIRENKDQFTKYDEKSRAAVEALEKAKGGLYINPDITLKCEYKGYPISRLIECADDQEICNAISAEYNKQKAPAEEGASVNEIVDVNYHLIFPSLNMFYRDYRYKSDDMLICQRMGCYYMFGK